MDLASQALRARKLSYSSQRNLLPSASMQLNMIKDIEGAAFKAENRTPFRSLIGSSASLLHKPASLALKNPTLNQLFAAKIE